MRELLEGNKNLLTNVARRKLEAKVLKYIEKADNGFRPLVVAKYFLQKLDVEAGESLTPLKLHKLVYYAKAWLLALFEKTFFSDSFEAWQHGPVIPDLYLYFKNLGYDCK